MAEDQQVPLCSFVFELADCIELIFINDSIIIHEFYSKTNLTRVSAQV